MIADAVGYQALEVLATAREAEVAGSTSRGLFLRIGGCRWPVFLSREPHRSPLTVRLPGPIPALPVRTRAWIGEGRLRLPGLEVLLPEGSGWHPPPPRGRPTPAGGRLQALAREAVRVKGDAGLAPVLRELSGLGPGPAGLPREALPAREALLSLRERLDPEAAVLLLGLGRGLTPSGDDALAGLLLALNRWGAEQGLNEALVEEAWRRTTSLSAALLELASRGEADERLLALVDHLFTGAPVGREWLDWGASSGVDALAGMAVAVLHEARATPPV